MKHFLFTLCVLLISFPAAAQVVGEDAAERLALSKEYHKLRPVKPQVDQAIEVVAKQLPEVDRKVFTARIKQALNYKAIETFSVEAMAEIFTVDEFKAMISYYSKPEAQSAAEKLPQYQQKMGPEIIKMLDRQLMEMRTGGAGN